VTFLSLSNITSYICVAVLGKVQKQESTIAELRAGMEALVAHIREQDAKIQRVTDQLKNDKAALQVTTMK
jgi:hypothetical protein